jgi:hypothetical protein
VPPRLHDFTMNIGHPGHTRAPTCLQRCTVSSLNQPTNCARDQLHSHLAVPSASRSHRTKPFKIELSCMNTPSLCSPALTDSGDAFAAIGDAYWRTRRVQTSPAASVVSAGPRSYVLLLNEAVDACGAPFGSLVDVFTMCSSYEKAAALLQQKSARARIYRCK